MQVCDSDFLNLNDTWYTDRPQLSRCFRDTALVWLPASVFVLLILVEFNQIRQAKLKGKKTIPYNSFNITRLLLIISLLCMKISELASYVYEILLIHDATPKPPEVGTLYTGTLTLTALLAPIIQSLSYLILCIIYIYQRRNGVHTSGPIWFSLSISLLCSAIDYYSVITSPSDNLIISSIDYMHFPTLVLLFLLECRGDTPELELDLLQDPLDDVRPTNPEIYASYCSSILFWWYNTFLLFGYKSKIRLIDLWRTLPRDKTGCLAPILCQRWLKKPAKILTKHQTSYVRTDGKVYQSNGMMMVLMSLFKKELIVAALLKLLQDLLQYLTPSILKSVLAHLKTENPKWHGVLLALLLLVVPTLQSVILGNYFYRIQLVAQHMKSMIMGAVYRKAIVLSGSSRQQSTTGEIVNLMSVDAQRFQDLLVYVNLVWSAPLQIVMAIGLLYIEMGWPVFAGVICMGLFLPCNAYVANRIKFTQAKLMKTKDERIKHINEIFSGIKVIKLYAWEKSFIASLFNYRSNELGFLGRILTFDAFQVFLWTCSPFVVSCVTFAVYVSVDSANVLDAEKAFVSISLFNLLKFPMSMLPSLVTTFMLTMVSSRRLSKFLNSDELVEYVTREDDPNAITIEGATMAWSSVSSASTGKLDSGKNGALVPAQPILREIDLRVKPGSFLAIVGQVASGKSSLISSILGEMHRISGSFNICKSMDLAYVPQRAFIQNMSLKENILFGSPYNDMKYKQVLQSCSLLDDLDSLPGGDEAEIGEKGINLSGGQKQRVSLARACYSDSDIYLLDDPLSALDSHVAKHIYDEVLSSTSGLLRGKTRVLVTNALFVLPHVDQVVVLDGGRIVESGVYDELMRNENGNLAEMMRQYNVNQENKSPSKSAKPSSKASKTSSISGGKTKEDPISAAVLKSSTEIRPTNKLGKLIDEEKMAEGTVSSRVYIEYFFNSYTPKWLFAIVICLCASAAFNVATNFWLSFWSSDSEDPNKSKDTDLRQTRMIVYSCLGGMQCLIILLSALALRQGALRAAKKLHTSLLERAMHSPMTFFDTTPLGRIVNRFAKDIDVVDSTLPGTFRSWISCLLNVLSTLFIICYSFPGLLIMLVPLACIYMIVQRVFIVTTRQLKRLESITRSPVYSNFNETLSGVSTIRAYNCVGRFVKYSDDVIDRNQSCSYPNIIANRWLSVRLEFFGNLITCSAALFAVLNGVSAGTAGLTISYSLSITQTLSWLVRMNSDLETHIVSVERILEYMDNEQEDKWIKNDSRPPRDWPKAGAIKFSHFSTRYRTDTDLVLRDVSIDIKPREKIGIVGRTGSGKSSLSLSLFRIIEATSGTISIDSLDILNFGLHDIRSRLTIIPQDPVLFSGTLRFNLDPLRLHSDLDIWRALELAHLRPYINGLAMGLDYQVSEYGENFSLGQRQLICLARAILRKTKILILDEATASVDLETDNVVQRTIRDVFNDCTIITIAHRLHTIMDSDRIIVLDSGQILELGSPEELMRSDQSAFSSLVRDAGMDLDQLRSNTTTSIREFK